MARTLSILLALASLIGMALATSAGAAVGLGEHRVVTKPHRLSATAARQNAATPLIAPAEVCPGQNSLDAPVEAQVQAMRCMTEFARAKVGLPGLTDAAALDASSRAKALDVLGCDSFSHSACGREFTYWMEETGYIAGGCWRAGENLAWGVGEEGTVRSVFLAWMRSATHRQNILGGYEELGISLEAGDLGGVLGARIWVQHFGLHCDS